MSEFRIRDAKGPEEMDFVFSSLRAHNVRVNPSAQNPSSFDVRLIVEDDDGNIVGGIAARIYRFCLGIETLWVDDVLRGKGYGKKLMMEAERIALEHNCTFAHVDTYSFQAPEFYKSLGYEVFAVLDDFVEGVEKIFLKKTFHQNTLNQNTFLK